MTTAAHIGVFRDRGLLRLPTAIPAHPGRPAGPGPFGEADGVPIEAVELTGDPGDLWLMDMRALHTAAPNASRSSRVMMTWRFLREG